MSMIRRLILMIGQNFFVTFFPISSDLADNGKLGYGFTSADELEEVDNGPGISHDQHLSAKS
jgi:hypothetical protein